MGEKESSLSKENYDYEQVALNILGRSNKIGIQEARKVTNVPFYQLKSEIEMIEKEVDRPMMIF